jgi:hypothetical protein
MEVTGEAQQQGGKPCEYSRCIERQENFVNYLCQNYSAFFDEKDDARKEEKTHALQKVGRENHLEAYHVLDITSRDRAKVKLQKSVGLTMRGSFPEFISIPHQRSTRSRYDNEESMETTPLLPTRSVTISVDEDTYHDRSIASKKFLSDASEVVGEMEALFPSNMLESDSSTEKPYKETRMAVRVFRQLQHVISKQIGSVVKKNPGATEPTRMPRTRRLLRVSNAAKNFCESIRRKWNTEPINDGEKAKRKASNEKSLKESKRCNHSRRHREAAVQRLKAMIEHMHSQSHADRDYHDNQQEKKDSFACSIHDNIDQILHQEVQHEKEGTDKIEPTNERSSFHSGHRDNALLPIAEESSIHELGAVLDEYFDQCNAADLKLMAPEGSKSTTTRELHELMASLSYSGSTECSSGDSSIDCSDLVEHEDNTVEKFGYYQHEFECFEHVVYDA